MGKCQILDMVQVMFTNVPDGVTRTCLCFTFSDVFFQGRHIVWCYLQESLNHCPILALIPLPINASQWSALRGILDQCQDLDRHWSRNSCIFRIARPQNCKFLVYGMIGSTKDRKSACSLYKGNVPVWENFSNVAIFAKIVCTIIFSFTVSFQEGWIYQDHKESYK